MCFTADFHKYESLEPGEMQVEEVTWNQLFQSKYKAYYELLREVVGT
jgi:hypothetical protein